MWFQNRRMKWRHTKEANKEETSSKRGEKVSYTQTEEANKMTESDYESVIDVQTIDSE